MDVFSLAARLTLDSSEYDSGLDDAKGRGESTFGSALGTAAKVGAAAIATATAAVGKFAADSVKTGMTFDSAMSQVAATMGYTIDELNTEGSEAANTFNTLSAFAQQMGSTTAFSASQAADALNYMALAGYDADTAMEMLPNVLNLAAAGGIELASASDMVTDAQSALGLSLEETSELVDKMAKASSKSNTSVAQLGDAILTIGGTAKSLAGGTTELSAALGILADNGIKGAEGGTALRNVLLGIQGDKFEETFGNLGVEAYDAQGNLRELSDILSDMSGAMDGMTDQQKTDLINKTFNRQDLKTVNALLATTTDRWEELSGAIDDSTGSAQAMAEVQLDNLSGDITLFQSALEGAKIAISGGLTPSIREFVQFGGSAVSQLTVAFQEGGLTGAMDSLGTIISDALAFLIQKMPEFIKAGTELVGALAQGIIKNLPEMVKAAMEIIVFLAQSLAEDIPELIPTIVGVVIQIVETLTDPSTLSSLVDASIAIIIAIANGLIDAMPQLIAAIPVIISHLVTAIVENIPKLFETGWELLSGLVNGIIDNLPALGTAAASVISSLLEGLGQVFAKVMEVGRNIVAGIHDGISEKWEWLKEKVGGFIDNFLGFFKNLLGIHSPSTVFAGFGENLIGGLMNGLSEKWDALKTKISDIASSVKDGFMEKVNAAATWGADLAANFGAGITNALSSVKSAVSTAANAVKSFLGFSEPDEGPLSNFHTYAPDMMKLFAEGIRKNEDIVTNQIAKSFDFSDAMTFGSPIRAASTYRNAEYESPITIIVQSVLDGKIIGETAYKYNMNRARAVGG